MRKSSKGNPNHDEKGRFCSAGKCKTVSFAEQWVYDERTNQRRLLAVFSEEEANVYHSMKKRDRESYMQSLQAEPKISKMLKERCNLIGFEYRVKTPSSVARKVAKDNVRVSDLNDVLRYTHIAKPENLAAETNSVLQSLQDDGVEVIQLKNTWTDEDNPYNGINVKLRKGDVKFELQFHTEESFEIKDGEMHRLYEKARVLPADSPELVRLTEEMFRLSDSMTRPDGIETVRMG